MSVDLLVLYAATIESLEVPIETNSDPTGAPPQFCLTSTSASAPGTFSAGSWVGTYNADTQLTTARTPTIGSAGSLTIASGQSYSLWVKVVLGGESAVWIVRPLLRCP